MLLPQARRALLLKEIELRGTVRSRAFAERLGVSEVTIRRDIVELDAEGLLERVHGGAVAVRTRRSRAAAKTLIGVLIPSDTSNFSEIVRGMEAAAPGLGVRLVLGVSHYSMELETDRARRLLDLGVEGMIVAPVVRGRTEEELADWLESMVVPTVVLERHLYSSRMRVLDHVRTDHRHGTSIVVEHLAGLGHRKVALACYDRTPTAASVQAGWREAVARLDLEPAPYRALPKGQHDLSDLRGVLAEFVSECVDQEVRAILAHTDQHATCLVDALHEAGLNVPRDMAVVAYDDIFAALAPVPLTAVSTPRLGLGEQALRLLVERLAPQGVTGSAPSAPSAPRHVELLPTLQVRESCGAQT